MGLCFEISPLYFLSIIIGFAIISTFVSAFKKYVKASIAIALISQIVPLILLPFVSSGTLGNTALVFDNLAKYGGLVIFLCAFITLLLFIGYFAKFEWLPHLNTTVVFSVLGALILITANDLIVFYIGWSMLGLPIYALIAISKDKIRSVEAAVKYFIMDVLDSMFLVFGIALLYGVVKTTSFHEIESLLSSSASNPYVLLAMIFIIAAFATRLALIPFHMYLPDIAEGAPHAILPIISVEDVAVQVALVRLAATVFYPLRDSLFSILAGFALITVIIGNIMALNQKNLLRLFAYSSFVHSGYIIAGVSIFTTYGFAAVLFHAFTSAISDLLIFGTLCVYSDTFGLVMLDDINGTGKYIPSISVGLSFGLLSSLGFPPLAAFWSKIFILFAVWDAGKLWLALVLAIGIGISVGYYARVFKHLWIDEPKKEIASKPIHDAYYVAIVLLILLILGIGFLPSIIFSLATFAVPIL